MKKWIIIAFMAGLVFFGKSYSQTNQTITTSGRNLIGVCGDTIILRGINYAPFSWSTDPADEKFMEIAKTGANCVRIPWFTSSSTGGGLLYDQLSMLDSAIARCIRNKMIAIIELHDLTGNPDFTLIPALSNWYLHTNVLAMIGKYKHNLIINIANEAGSVQNSQQLVEFQNTYQNVVSNLRLGGITVPLMIDSPNNGTDIDLLFTVAPAILANDPQSNLIFSAHAYWYYYANNDSVIFRNKIMNALAQNVPLVLGEVCNLEYGTVPCQLAVNYKPLLKICQELHVSWLSWAWDHDVCANSQISTNGNFNSLSTYGGDITNNVNYGLKTHSTLTRYLHNSESCIAGVNEISNIQETPIKVISVDGEVKIQSLVSKPLNISVYDITGRKTEEFQVSGFDSQSLKLPSGIYLLSVFYNGKFTSTKISF